MKKSTLIVVIITILNLLIGSSMLNAQAKPKQIKYAKCAVYFGDVEKRSPMGQGKLTINEGATNLIVVTGLFNDTNITECVMTFTASGITFKGDVSFQKKVEMLLLIPSTNLIFELKKGEFYHNDQYLGTINEPVNIKFDCSMGIATAETAKGVLGIPNTNYDKIVELAIKYAGEDKYSIQNPPLVSFSMSDSAFEFGDVHANTNPYTLIFDNGTVTPFEKTESQTQWTRHNGDFIEFGTNWEVRNCKISTEEYEISDSIVVYRFNNGNTFEGVLTEKPEANSIQNILSLYDFKLNWEDFCTYAKSGKLTYSDGSSYNGLFSSDGVVENDRLNNNAYLNGDLFGSDGNKITHFTEGLTEEEWKAAEAKRRAEEEERARAEAEAEAKRRAQYEEAKKSDFYEFDEEGVVREFLLTYPDLTKHEYKRIGKEIIVNRMTYTDGVIGDWQNVCWTNDDFKILRKQSAADSHKNPSLYLRRTYQDGNVISLSTRYTDREGYEFGYLEGVWAIEETVKENGDYAILTGRSESISVMKMQKTLEDYTIHYESELKLVYANGNVYKGKFELIYEGESEWATDPRTQELRIKVEGSYNNVAGAKITDGNVFDKNGNIIAIYKNGQKLDDFEFDAEIAKLKAEEAKEKEKMAKEAAENAKAQKMLAEYYKKYGKANVDAALKGRIVVGMHEDLLRVVGNTNYWDFELYNQTGSSKIYIIKRYTQALETVTVGYVYTSNSKVTSVTWR